ncbi:MAG: T9SS type A sorting domain-containing protein, partial [Bacteroidales bacterium]|nr:T9SS type A sorting domain-containing protein [Bacteroidales bacterium]
TTNDPWTFDDVSIMRSRHNTTYFATRSNKNYEQGHDDCYLYEFDDDLKGAQEVVPVVHELHRGNYDFDFVAEGRAVDVAVDGSVYFCYSLNVGFSLANDSWVVIEKFDEDMNPISEVYYGTRDDMIWYCAESITLTRDGGVLMTTHMKELTNQSHRGSVVVKFPAEAFQGIEEAHDNGLKVAVAYPNPGKDVLNIRTGLRNARVEVYDINGRIIHSQALTENVTAIDAGDWAEGVYVWKVMANGKEVESGKWIKAL